MSLVSESLASHYMQLIGILRWVVELGKIDIFYEKSLFYLNIRQIHNLDWGRLAYDSATPNNDYTVLNNNADWTCFYGKVKEELPPKEPKPKGNPVTVSAFVDANHTGNIVTCCSHSGILIYVHNA
jgi:hypothetical protein